MKSQQVVQEQPHVYDYPELRKQTGDYISAFYGPHSCDGCGRYDVIKQSFEQGAASWENATLPGCLIDGIHGPTFKPHHCTHILLFKRLAGRILTVLDASLSASPSQHKAVKDLVRQEFARIISRARELEGDRSGETNGSLEQLAENCYASGGLVAGPVLSSL